MSYHPFQTMVHDGKIFLEKKELQYSASKLNQFSVYAKGGLRITKARFGKEKPLKGTEPEIIEQIHKIRFGEQNPYVITGGHFSPLFVRNLGIFYNALLDPRIPASDTDWLMRQEISLRTIALDLEIFRLAERSFTTIYPIKKNIFTGRDVYARPSDSLFAILYTLCSLTDETFIESVFPAELAKRELQTKKTAKQLLVSYEEFLKQLIKTYYVEILDENTGLIKTTILLSSARDGIKRQSSFYDNVIAWATMRLGRKLKLYPISQFTLATWKEHIIKTFWDEQNGIFLDDLSSLSQISKLFSADSFVVLSTGFFNVKNKIDMDRLQQMVNYVKRKKLDIPFPLHYSTIDLPKNLYRPVRYFAPSYMGRSIWSHWGMEYIKALIYVSDNAKQYLSDAKKHIASYRKNIEQYGGYPEVYDKKGKLLRQRFYRSVLHNGWVINYEQTKMLLASKIVNS